MWYQRTVEETEHFLQTSAGFGLSAREHDRRLEENGKNILKETKKIPPWQIFLRQFTDFMVMVLMGAAALSAFMGERVDALMIVAIIVVNSILGFIQEFKAERSLESLKKLTEDEARVVIDGEVRILKAEELVVGDVVLLEHGTKVPADIRITESLGLRADESILTGESAEVKKTSDIVTEDAPLSKRSNMCYSGTVITGGRGKGIVVNTAMGTELGQIAEILEQKSAEMTPLQEQLKKLGKILIVLCVAVCACVSVAGMILGGDIYTMILTGISLGVASIPEGLPIVVTICFALGVRRLTAVNAIVRRLPIVETLGCVSCICTDKTGTLTKNRMETRYFYGEGEWHGIKEFGRLGSVADDTNLVLGNCHSLYQENGKYQGDPTEVALIYGARNNGAPMTNVNVLEERSFDSDRKMMSVRCVSDGQRCSLVKGAPDRVLECCCCFRKGAMDVPMGASDRLRIQKAVREYANKGYRVLAVAMRKGDFPAEEMEQDLTFLSLAALKDPLRDDAASSLRVAAEAGIRSIMITGDQRGTALSIGRELGIASSEEDVIGGEELGALSDKELAVRLKEVSVAASVTPSDKMRIVSLLRRGGAVCAMTGDGVNDAPALKEADVGIAMGKKGTDVTKDAADFILADDNFSSIVEAIRQGRGIYDNIRKSIRYLLSSNLGEILVMLIAVLLCFPLPLLPVQILWINLVT
ncbi:MAG: HAD-IC family P-type ATPase, partial [Firmicutes bacterium]|nr:HAD-IC family P-type ATPase [Bacillota bacterium]